MPHQDHLCLASTSADPMIYLELDDERCKPVDKRQGCCELVMSAYASPRDSLRGEMEAG